MEIIFLIMIGLGAAAFIYYKMRKAFKKSDCGSCCGSCNSDCSMRSQKKND